VDRKKETSNEKNKYVSIMKPRVLWQSASEMLSLKRNIEIQTTNFIHNYTVTSSERDDSLLSVMTDSLSLNEPSAVFVSLSPLWSDPITSYCKGRKK